ncbi:MAG TPA: hypothetical protein VML55_15975 [Planctomycetaceae bacterium]|nr:hypothetical protein [Planctomycetaceae bacterium]
MATKHRCVWLATLALAGHAAASRAADLHLELVEGLRSRGYHDTAVVYLDQIENDARVSQDVRTVIPFERAVTLLQSARSLGPEARREPLDRAQAQFEAFTRANPDHPLSARANTERARILLENARLGIWQARSPANKGQEQPFRDEARALIARARTVFQTAHDQHKAAWEQFGVFIPETERQKIEARKQAEIAYMQTQMDLAMCTYEEAQTHPRDSAEFKRLLTRAAEDFEAIHEKYRSIVVGLYARMWQAKCFEEQGGREGLGRALGIYNELLGHPGDSQTMQILKGHVRHFWCICQNQRNESQLVIQAADEWVKNNRVWLRTPFGIGIRWELVQALEAYAQDRTLAAKDKERLLRQALGEAEAISRIAGQYRDVAAFAVPRIKVALNIDPGDPRDFDTALGRGRTMIKPGIFDRQQAIDAERAGQKRADELAALERDLADHLRETGRVLELAVNLSDSKTDPRHLLEAHYLLAYVHYLQDRAFEAGVLAEFVGRKFREADPEFALKSAYLSMAAWTKVYNASPQPEDDRTFEVDRIIRACQLVTGFWPQSEEAQGARIQLGRIFSRREQPAEAARWYSEVPESAEQYAEAQLAAGQAWWNAYLKAAARRDDAGDAEQPAPEQLDEWQRSAEGHLKVGIARVEAATPKDQESPVDLIAGKVTMAQILVNRGEYDAAVKLLKTEPHAPEQAIQVKQGETRPKSGIKSPAFASLVYQLFLRSYVGTKNIDEALRVMEQLERAVPEGDDGTAVTAIYIKLGRELQNEIERLRASPSGNRLTEVLASFEEFLSALTAQRERMNYSALIWIAETWYYLAEGIGSGNLRAQDYYGRAAETYQDILGRPQGFVPGGKDLGVKLRLVNCRRSQGEYQQALELVGEVLAGQPMALQAQIEAAQVLQSWGESGEPEAHKHLREAIQGRDIGTQKKAVWGWAGIVRMLANRPEYREQSLQARYNSAVCRRQYGLEQSSGAKGKAELEHARTELEMFARVSGPEQLGDEWWKKFEGMYHTLQRDLNQATTPLPRPVRHQPRPLSAVGSMDLAARPAGTSARLMAGSRPRAAAAVPVKSTSPVLVILGLLVAAGGAGGIVFWMVQSQKRSRRPRLMSSAIAPAFTPPAMTADPSRSSRTAAPAARRKPAVADDESRPSTTAGPAPAPGGGARTRRSGQPPASG